MGAATSSLAVHQGSPGVRFVLDENIPPAFAAALKLVGYATFSNEEVGLKAASDVEVIDFCRINGMVWVTKDLDARKKAAYASQVRRLRVSVVFMSPPRAKGWSSKEQFETLARNLRRLEIALELRNPRYFILRQTGRPREVTSFAARPGR